MSSSKSAFACSQAQAGLGFFGANDLAAEHKRYNAARHNKTRPHKAVSLCRGSLSIFKSGNCNIARTGIGSKIHFASNIATIAGSNPSSNCISDLNIDANFPILQRVSAHEADAWTQSAQGQQQQQQQQFEFLIQSFSSSLTLPAALQKEIASGTETETRSFWTVATTMFEWGDALDTQSRASMRIRRQELFEQRIKMAFREMNRKVEGRWKRRIGRMKMCGRRVIGL